MAMKLLIARGSAEDVKSIVRELRQAGMDPAPLHVQTEGEFVAALDRGSWEAALVHSASPHPDLLTFAGAAHDHGVDMPFIAITPRLDTAEAVLALRAGATHCLARGEMWRLPEILQGEIADAARRRLARETEQSHQAAAERYRELLGLIPAATYVARTDATRSTAFVSSQVEAMTGYTPEEWVSDPGLWPRQVTPRTASASSRSIAAAWPAASRSSRVPPGRRDGRWSGGATKAGYTRTPPRARACWAGWPSTSPPP